MITLGNMPSTSKTQQRLMGVAYAVKNGDMQLSDVDSNYRDKVESLIDGMTLKQLKDFAETKHDDLPEEITEGIIKIDINRVITKIMSAVGFKQNPKMREELKSAFLEDIREIMNKYDYVTEAEDHEVGMAMGQLSAIHEAAGELEEKIGNEEKDIPAWIQAHITSAYEYLKQANDNFHELEESNSEFFKGGIANGMSAQDLADHHEISLQDIESALSAGQKVEMEHTNDKDKAYEIAKDHIYEDPKYYEKLAKIEEADFYNIEPGNIGGMGPISLPGVDNVGSGDIPAGVGSARDRYEDELKKRKKKNKKKKSVLEFKQFLEEQYQLKPFEPNQGKEEKLGDGEYEKGPANDPDAEAKEIAKARQRARKVVTFKEFRKI